jgi:hypothetical protein
LKTVAARHQQIAQNHFGAVFEREFQADLAILGLQDAPAVFVQPMGKRIAERSIIIDQQSGFHGATFSGSKKKTSVRL